MVLDVPPPPKEVLLNQNSQNTENSETIRKRVIKAHNIQLKRQSKSNDKLAPDEIEKLVNLSQDNKQLLSSVIDKLNLSARAYHRILKVARTIADLDESKMVDKPHLIEAISYRRFNQ